MLFGHPGSTRRAAKTLGKSHLLGVNYLHIGYLQNPYFTLSLNIERKISLFHNILLLRHGNWFQ